MFIDNTPLDSKDSSQFKDILNHQQKRKDMRRHHQDIFHSYHMITNHTIYFICNPEQTKQD